MHPRTTPALVVLVLASSAPTAQICFEEQVPTPLTMPAEAGRAADLDGDGTDDLAIAQSLIFGPGAVGVLHGNGDGTFTPLVSVPSTEPPLTVRCADLDLDGDIDILASWSASSAGLRALFNDGSGAGYTALDIPMTFGSWDIELDDLDLDGDLDVAAGTGGFLVANIELFENTVGAFLPAGTFAAGFSAYGLTIGDLDGDGLSEVVAADLVSDDLAILLNQGGLSFAPTTSGSGLDNPRDIVSADFDGDGDIDIAAGDEFGDVGILTNDGLGALTLTTLLPGPHIVVDLHAGDMDCDGRVDLVALNDQDAILGYWNEGGLSFEASPVGETANARSIALGDWNGDPQRDLAVFGDDVRGLLGFGCAPHPGATAPLGCGVNPAGSMTLLSGLPDMGATMVFGLDDPTGSQPIGAIPVVFVSNSPDIATPCGTLTPGLGLGGPGTDGELLICVSAGCVLRRGVGSPWTGPGNPAPVAMKVPVDCRLLGLTLYAQGALIDPSVGAPIPIGLTDGFELTVGI